MWEIRLWKKRKKSQCFPSYCFNTVCAFYLLRFHLCNLFSCRIGNKYQYLLFVISNDHQTQSGSHRSLKVILILISPKLKSFWSSLYYIPTYSRFVPDSHNLVHVQHMLQHFLLNSVKNKFPPTERSMINCMCIVFLKKIGWI